MARWLDYCNSIGTSEEIRCKGDGQTLRSACENLDPSRPWNRDVQTKRRIRQRSTSFDRLMAISTRRWVTRNRYRLLPPPFGCLTQRRLAQCVISHTLAGFVFAVWFRARKELLTAAPSLLAFCTYGSSSRLTKHGAMRNGSTVTRRCFGERVG